MTGLEHLSDAAVVARMARGDELALDALYTRYGHLAYGLSLRILRDAKAAEKVVIAAFADIWQRSFERGPPRDTRGQLLYAVHRRCAEIVRSSGRLREQSPDVVPRPQPNWISLEAQGGRELLNQLADQDRQALELAYYSCYTRDEIASLLAVSIAEVTSRISNGLERLSELRRAGVPRPAEGATSDAGRPARPFG